MWICFNDGLVSAVQDRENPRRLVIRARRREILERLFPGEKVVVGGSTDYNYRVFCDRAAFAETVRQNVLDIDYGNFKNSVEDPELHDLYASFWELHFEYQR